MSADFSIVGLKIFPTADPRGDPEAKVIASTSAEDKVLRDTMEAIRSEKKFNPLYNPLTWNCRHFTNRHKYDGMAGKPIFRIESVVPIYPPVRP